jgi:phosphomannomutase / phosphoglucomutase
MAQFDPRIFRAYDIRGKADSQVTEETCMSIGQAFGSKLRTLYRLEHPRVAVGRDGRLSSPALEQAVVEGLMKTGCEVLRIGETPSPVNYFAICSLGLDGGVQVTASHNEAGDNGLKLQVRDAEPFSGEDLQTLREEIERGEFLKGEGKSREIDVATPYLCRLTEKFVNVGADLHVVIDAGNGIAGPLYTKALKAVGCTVTELYTTPDGTFPNHLADPSQLSTLQELQAKVREVGAHLGLAFDGDGDRLGVVDEKGAIRSSDEVLLLLARDLLTRHPHSPIVFTVSNSGILFTEIAAWGGKPLMCKVGHSYVEHVMREKGSLLGGEQSGHFFCAEGYHCVDDALVAALHMLRILQAESAPLSSLLDAFPKVYQAPERRPACTDDEKQAVIEKVTAHFLEKYPVETMDGARIDFGDGAWASLRQSNTSPCLSICIEARDPTKLKEVENTVLTHLKSYLAISL